MHNQRANIERSSKCWEMCVFSLKHNGKKECFGYVLLPSCPVVMPQWSKFSFRFKFYLSLEHQGAACSSHCPAKWINMTDLFLPTSRHSHTSLWPPSPQVPLFFFSQPGQCGYPLSFWSSVKSSSLRNPLWPGDPGCPPAAGAMTAVLLWHTQVWILEPAPRCCGPGCWSSVVLFLASGSSVCPARASLCDPGHPVGCTLQLLRYCRLHCQQNLGTSDWTNANGAWGSASHQIPSSPIRTSSTGFGDEGLVCWIPKSMGMRGAESFGLSLHCLQSASAVPLLPHQ